MLTVLETEEQLVSALLNGQPAVVNKSWYDHIVSDSRLREMCERARVEYIGKDLVCVHL